MRQLTALVWKEWHETQLFLWIGWGLFIGLPIIAGIEGMSRNVSLRFEFYASLWVLMLGPVLAIVVGVAVTCRDVQPKLEDFWQSRPIGGARLFVVKYVVAAAVILLTCCVPLGIEVALGGNTGAGGAVFFMAFLWLAVFSIAFAVGCVVRRTAHAAAMAIVGTLLLFFLPVVFPPLSRFMITQIEVISATGPLLKFAGGMLVVSAVMGAIGLLAVRRHWHIESSKPLIYGAVSISFLILIVSASYQLGTNLPVLDHALLPENEIVQGLSRDNLWTEVWSPPATGTGQWHYVPFERPVRVKADRIDLGERRPPTSDQFQSRYTAARGSSTQPVIFSFFPSWDMSKDGISDATLEVWRARSNDDKPLVKIELWKSSRLRVDRPYIYVLKDRLYVAGQRSMVFDISDPLSPKLLSEVLEGWHPDREKPTDRPIAVPLPPAPGLSVKQRLDFLVKADPDGQYFQDGDDLLWWHESRSTITLHRLASTDDHYAKFDFVSSYKPTLVQTVTGLAFTRFTRIVNGLLYQVDNAGHLAVYNLLGPKPLSLIAHFVTDGGLSAMDALPDGRLLIGGIHDVWLLGPPPRH